MHPGRESHTQHPADATAFTLAHLYSRQLQPRAHAHAYGSERGSTEQSQGHRHMYASANATHTSRHNRGTSSSGPGLAGFPDHSAQGQKRAWPCPRIAAPGHRSSLTGTPYHNAQSRAAWREGSRLPRPSQTDRSSPGQQDRPRATCTYPPEPPEFNRPPCLGRWETCTKDSGPPHPHLSCVPVRRGPYLCLKRDTAPTTECALRLSGGEGAKPGNQSSGLPRPVRMSWSGVPMGAERYLGTAMHEHGRAQSCGRGAEARCVRTAP